MFRDGRLFGSSEELTIILIILGVVLPLSFHVLMFLYTRRAHRLAKKFEIMTADWFRQSRREYIRKHYSAEKGKKF
jgi:hypothetical protein